MSQNELLFEHKSVAQPSLRAHTGRVPFKSAVLFRRVKFNKYLVRAFSCFGGSVKTELVENQKAAKEGIDGLTFIYSL